MKEKYAFARSAFYHPVGGECDEQNGMTERNYMALKILCALLSNPDRLGMYAKRETAVNDAYYWADAMLAARDK